MRIAFKTFGCRLNHAEALEEEARLGAAGHAIVPLDADPAPDCIVVRGCSVTAKAAHESEKEVARLRARFPAAEIRRAGCLPGAARDAPPPPDAPVPRATSRAYLKVQDGCSGRCTFCIVPQFRGAPASVPFAHVLARARAFLAAGYRELVVTGCNLALYRDAGRRLPDLVAALAALDGPAPHRLRLSSLEPGLCGADLLDALAAHPNVCRFLHLSLQSASDRILRRMNRPYAREDVAAFCDAALRRLGPRLALGADVIAGFPGETDADHAATLDFLARLLPSESAPAFSLLHVFPFSERPGTAAAALDGALPHAVRRARAQELAALGRRLRAAYARSFIGRTVEVCVERSGLFGRTAEYLPCRLAAPAPRRTLVAARVAACEADGTLAAAPSPSPCPSA